MRLLTFDLFEMISEMRPRLERDGASLRSAEIPNYVRFNRHLTRHALWFDPRAATMTMPAGSSSKILLGGRLPRVRVVAATYYDDRGVGGSEDVTIYHRRTGRTQRASVQAPVDDWHALARLASDGGCFVKYGPSIEDYPADEDPDEIFGDHDIAVHVRLANPVYMEVNT
jgi:hypothetical protein